MPSIATGIKPLNHIQILTLNTMDLIDSLKEIASRIEKQIDHIATEEATKNALIMPVINALGYNVFDPTEVIPEFTADHANKKGEKVDYAIVHDGKPMILIECKKAGSSLNLKHADQLFRYFSVTEARFAILTNGIDYRFYTDIEAPNKMDEKPFFEFSMLHITEQTASELKKFSKESFDLENILSTASELKYTKQIINLLEQEYENPKDDFVRYFTIQVISGNFLPSIKEQFKPLVKNAFREFIISKINARLKNAIEGYDEASISPAPTDRATEPPSIEDDGIVTTEEETEAYHIVKAILSKYVSPNRIVMRDTKSYCGVLLDDNNRKPLCRLHFNYSTKYIGVFDSEKNETRIQINTVDQIYEHENKLTETISFYS